MSGEEQGIRSKVSSIQWVSNGGVSKKEKRGSATSKPLSMHIKCLADCIPFQPLAYPSDSRSGGIDVKSKAPANAQIRHNVPSNPTLGSILHSLHRYTTRDVQSGLEARLE